MPDSSRALSSRTLRVAFHRYTFLPDVRRDEASAESCSPFEGRLSPDPFVPLLTDRKLLAMRVRMAQSQRDLDVEHDGDGSLWMVFCTANDERAAAIKRRARLQQLTVVESSPP